MEKLISDELNSVLLLQWGHERLNANIYLYVYAWLKNKGLDGLSSIFKKQHDEEIGHSQIILDLLTDLSSPVILPEIDEVNIPINSIMDIAEKYLSREIETTNSLNEIKKLAIEEDSPVVEERMREMIKLQQNEYEEATGFMDKAQMTGNDWRYVMMWDLGVK